MDRHISIFNDVISKYKLYIHQLGILLDKNQQEIIIDIILFPKVKPDIYQFNVYSGINIDTTILEEYNSKLDKIIQYPAIQIFIDENIDNFYKIEKYIKHYYGKLLQYSIIDNGDSYIDNLKLQSN